MLYITLARTLVKALSDDFLAMLPGKRMLLYSLKENVEAIGQSVFHYVAIETNVLLPFLTYPTSLLFISLFAKRDSFLIVADQTIN